MPAAPADLTISSRWMLPMTAPDDGCENHTLVVRDGRIIDLAPHAVAAARYAATLHVDRSRHLLLPGLVNAGARIAPPAGRIVDRGQLHDAALLGIADMLASGTTCFCAVGPYPQETARAAAQQGMRTLIGMPIAAQSGACAFDPDECLTRALALRDEYRGHPLVATAFAPVSPAELADSTLRRIATLADELDAGIVTALNESHSAIEYSIARHAQRPLERLRALGLLTPSLTALHMTHVGADDTRLAHDSGIGVALCPEADVRAGHGPAAAGVASLWGTGLRLGIGSGTGTAGGGLDLWTAVRLLAGADTDGAWQALAAVTRGGAAALGLDAQIGTLETGKWADVCCIDLEAPALRWARRDPAREAVAELVWSGGRGSVSDVWVAGRQVLNSGAFTRLDCSAIEARVQWRRDLHSSGE